MKIKTIETEKILHFLHRPSMYVGNVSRSTIVSFMHGVDFGRRRQPHWTVLLKEFISTHHQIDGGALGWPNQVCIYSHRHDIDWISGFRILRLEMIEKSNEIPYTEKLKRINQNLTDFNKD